MSKDHEEIREWLDGCHWCYRHKRTPDDVMGMMHLSDDQAKAVLILIEAVEERTADGYSYYD